MNAYFVTYTLSDRTSYEALRRRLKSYPNWGKLFARAWIINTNRSSTRVRDELIEAINGQGQIVVVNITDSAWATCGLEERVLKWMRENI